MDMEAVIAVTGLEIAQVAQKGDIKFMDVSGCNITSYFQISDQVRGLTLCLGALLFHWFFSSFFSFVPAFWSQCFALMLSL